MAYLIQITSSLHTARNFIKFFPSLNEFPATSVFFTWENRTRKFCVNIGNQRFDFQCAPLFFLSQHLLKPNVLPARGSEIDLGLVTHDAMRLQERIDLLFYYLMRNSSGSSGKFQFQSVIEWTKSRTNMNHHLFSYIYSFETRPLCGYVVRMFWIYMPLLIRKIRQRKKSRLISWPNVIITSWFRQ